LRGSSPAFKSETIERRPRDLALAAVFRFIRA